MIAMEARSLLENAIAKAMCSTLAAFAAEMVRHVWVVQT